MSMSNQSKRKGCVKKSKVPRRVKKIRQSGTGTQKLSNFVDSMNTKEKNILDIAVAKFFFGCNIPFAVCESDHFRYLLKKLRPSYEPPCRSTLSGTLLDEVFQLISNEDRRIIGTEAVILIDGWKNSTANTKNVVTMLHTAN